MASNVSLEALTGHLFEAIEGVKNLSDPMASENEKISIAQAKAIVGLSEQIIEIKKTQIEAVRVFTQKDDVAPPGNMLAAFGITDQDELKQIGF